MKSYRCVIYNADNGRPVEGPAEIARLMTHRHIGFFVEAGGYARRVRSLLPDGYRVFAPGDAMFVVGPGVRARGLHLHDLRTGGWERDPKNSDKSLHPGRKMPSLLIDDHFKVGVPHLPPPPHDNDRDYPLRGRAFDRGIRRLEVIATRWSETRPWVLGGDWNTTVGSPVMRKFRRALGAQAEGVGVDYPVSWGLEVTGVRRVPASGDHGHATVFRVIP